MKKIAVISPSKYFYNLWLVENRELFHKYIFVKRKSDLLGQSIDGYEVATFGNQANFPDATLEELEAECVLRMRKSMN